MTALKHTTLPWSGDPALEAPDFREKITLRCGDDARFLPTHMRMLAYPGADPDLIAELVEQIAQFLAGEELARWRARRERFVELGLCTKPELDHLLDPANNPQPWIIHATRDGGGEQSLGSPDDSAAEYGNVPCSTMVNHGVTWKRNMHGFMSWLVTDRKKGQPWDFASDIGHEGAHAAFSPVPLFSQMINLDARAVSLETAEIPSMSHAQWSRLAYVLCELAVVAVRGERRDTLTGLPTLETMAELRHLPSILHSLMPRYGFDRVLGAIDWHDAVDPDGDAMFAIGIAALRVMHHLKREVHRGEPLGADWYRALCA